MSTDAEGAQTGIGDLTGSKLTRLYERRFSQQELAAKRVLWDALCRGFFDRYVGTEDTVLDLGAGTCEFINACRGREKIAVDLNPEVKRWVDSARAIVTRSDNLIGVDDDSVDVVFTSNFFEHLASKAELLDTLAECWRVLRPEGHLLVLMPNLRYVKGRYWDYFDHQLPLTHLSLVEGVRMAGFDPLRVIPRFLPYTVKDLPIRIRPALVHAYLRAPVVWRLLGGQMFVVARKHLPSCEA
jgi:SAM-dependent methyltransferase